MNIRIFIGDVAVGTAIVASTHGVFGRSRTDLRASWGVLDTDRFPVSDCHEMVQDVRGRFPY